MREGACNSFNGEIKSVTIFSNTKLREIFECSVYFPSTPSKLFVLLFLVTLFISPSILPLWELHALSLYKPLVQASNCMSTMISFNPLPVAKPVPFHQWMWIESIRIESIQIESDW